MLSTNSDYREDGCVKSSCSTTSLLVGKSHATIGLLRGFPLFAMPGLLVTA